MRQECNSQIVAFPAEPNTASGTSGAAPEGLGQKRVQSWYVAATARLRNIAATIGLLLVLYIGSYFATAFATGAGWMEVATRQRIVWTVHQPLSMYAVSEPISGRRYINDANGWLFTFGWQWFHE